MIGTVRVRERAGSAIAVCEQPPALELGASAEEVLDRIKARLRAALVPGVRPGFLVVVREQRDAADISLEALA